MMKKAKLYEYWLRNPHNRLRKNMIILVGKENLLIDQDTLDVLESECLIIKQEEVICCAYCGGLLDYLEDQFYCSQCEETKSKDELEMVEYYILNQMKLIENSFDEKKMKKVSNNPELAGGLKITMNTNEIVDDDFLAILVSEIVDCNENVHMVQNVKKWVLGFGQQYIYIEIVGPQKVVLYGKESYLFRKIMMDLAYTLDVEDLKRDFYIKYLPDFNREKLTEDLHQYIPNIDRLVPINREDVLDNLLIAFYFLGVRSNLPDVTFYAFNALRGLESIIKLIAYNYDIKYTDKLEMFCTKRGRVDATPETKKKLGSSVKISIYKKMYQVYKKDRNGYLHWDKFMSELDSTNILRTHESARTIITKILDLINDACNNL